MTVAAGRLHLGAHPERALGLVGLTARTRVR